MMETVILCNILQNFYMETCLNPLPFKNFPLVKIKYILREKRLYSKFFWSVFSCIQTDYGEILPISPYSVRMRENTDRKNSE